MLKRFVKNERGLTLIELLAVIVILGIIAAIAIPSIGGLIDNSKKDAHIANAKQMVNAARLAITSSTTNTNTTKFTLSELVSGGYLEKVPKSPGDAGAYDGTNSFVTVTKDSNGNLSYTVTLATSGDNSHKYIDNEDAENLTRSDVSLK